MNIEVLLREQDTRRDDKASLPIHSIFQGGDGRWCLMVYRGVNDTDEYWSPTRQAALDKFEELNPKPERRAKPGAQWSLL